MKTNFISPDGVFILKTQKPADCPFFENPEGFSWCHVGLFIDPATLPPRSTGRNGGWFGVVNGRSYSFPVKFSYPTFEAAKSECTHPTDTVLPISIKYGGGFVVCCPGLPTSIKNMIMEPYIYRTNEAWGSEVYFFTESKYNEFMAGMAECWEGELLEPDIFHLDETSGLYEGKFYKNYGREKLRVTDWDDPANLQIEYV